jgi:hypothetical protein
VAQVGEAPEDRGKYQCAHLLTDWLGNEEEIAEVKEENDIKPAIQPGELGSGNDEAEGIEYMGIGFSGEGSGKGTEDEPFVVYGLE